MRVRGVIFDLDGTLIDSLADIARAGNAVLARRGRPAFSMDDYRGFIGNGIGVLVRRAWGLPDDSEDPILAELIDEVRHEYAKHCLDQTKPYEGIEQLIAELRRREVSLAVLSNKPDPMTQAMVSQLFDPGVFSSVAGQRRGIPRKPDPAGALRAAEFMSLAPHQCAMVGDLQVDLETGQRAGMRSVAVSWGFGDEEQLLQSQPDLMVRRPLDLLELV